jgi:hypothetical protein
MGQAVSRAWEAVKFPVLEQLTVLLVQALTAIVVKAMGLMIVFNVIMVKLLLFAVISDAVLAIRSLIALLAPLDFI